MRDKTGDTIPSTPDTYIHTSARRDNFLAAGAILLYCFAYAAMRLLISSSMELSEAEQFLDASAFSFGYSQQAPLYSWIVRGVTLLFGMNIVTLTAIKYSLLFSFYFSFYLIARYFWDSKTSLLITGSLLLFPTYAYEVHRDLTHTILVSLMAAITCYLYIRTVRDAKTVYYLLAGISIGLGILSKYNFILFLTALLLSSLSYREGRRVIFDKRTLLSMLCILLVLLPHLVWLTQENFASFRYALARSEAGKSVLNPQLKAFSLIGFSYLEALLFSCVAGVFFRRYFSINENKDNDMLRIFRLLAFYGLIVPLCVIILLRAGNFTSRWLVPVFFPLPLAVFSFVGIDMRRVEFRLFGYLCVFIAAAVLAARAFIGFFPDTTGKVERIHVPYKALSQQLAAKLKDSDIADPGNLAVIADADDKYDRCIAANIMAWMPAMKYVPLRDPVIENAKEQITAGSGILVSHIPISGVTLAGKFIAAYPFELSTVTLESPYLHSSTYPPYVLKVVIIPGREAYGHKDYSNLKNK